MSGPSPQEKLAAAQADQEKWSQIAANPDLSPRAAQWALGMALSAKAEVRLRQKGLAWQAEQNGKPKPARPAPASVPMSLANWKKGQILASLSLAQRESADAAPPARASSSKSSVPMSREDWKKGRILASLSLAQQEGAQQGAPPEPNEAARRAVIASDSRKS